MVPRTQKSCALQAQRLQHVNIAAKAISGRFRADLPNEIARRLDGMFPHRDANIALHEPEFNNQAETSVLQYVQEGVLLLQDHRRLVIELKYDPVLGAE